MAWYDSLVNAVKGPDVNGSVKKLKDAAAAEQAQRAAIFQNSLVNKQPNNAVTLFPPVAPGAEVQEPGNYIADLQAMQHGPAPTDITGTNQSLLLAPPGQPGAVSSGPDIATQIKAQIDAQYGPQISALQHAAGTSANNANKGKAEVLALYSALQNRAPQDAAVLDQQNAQSDDASARAYAALSKSIGGQYDQARSSGTNLAASLGLNAAVPEIAANNMDTRNLLQGLAGINAQSGQDAARISNDGYRNTLLEGGRIAGQQGASAVQDIDAASATKQDQFGLQLAQLLGQKASAGASLSQSIQSNAAKDAATQQAAQLAQDKFDYQQQQDQINRKYVGSGGAYDLLRNEGQSEEAAQSSLQLLNQILATAPKNAKDANKSVLDYPTLLKSLQGRISAPDSGYDAPSQQQLYDALAAYLGQYNGR